VNTNITTLYLWFLSFGLKVTAVKDNCLFIKYNFRNKEIETILYYFDKSSLFIKKYASKNI